MSNFNKLIVLGHLTRDLDLLYTTKGTAVANFDVAVNRYWKGEDGSRQEEVCFIPCSCFGNLASRTAEYCSKGDQILIEGHMTTDKWQDQQGNNRQKLKCIVERVQFVKTKKSQGGQEQSQPATTTPASQAATPYNQGGQKTFEEDDVPF